MIFIESGNPAKIPYFLPVRNQQLGFTLLADYTLRPLLNSLLTLSIEIFIRLKYKKRKAARKVNSNTTFISQDFRSHAPARMRPD